MAERRLTKLAQKELKEAEKEVWNMDAMVKDAWFELKEEQKAKRYAQKELRDERSASQELVRHYSKAEAEISAFRSNKEGYVKRRDFNDIEQKYNKLLEEHRRADERLGAWKSQCGRFQERITIQQEQIGKQEELVVKLQEKLELVELNAKSVQGQLDFQRSKTEDVNKQLLSF